MFTEAATPRTRFLDVEVEHVDLSFDGNAVLRDLRWRVRPGERWVLVGGNGAGKTQLLKILAGDVWPTPTGRERVRYRLRGHCYEQPEGVKDTIAYLGPERQDRYERYDWNFSVTAVVGTGIHRSDIPLDPLSAADKRRIEGLLARLRITHLARRRFLTLSYGERRLVLLARALAWRPSLLLLDEVANGLDAAHRERLMQFLAGTGRSALPWVLTTHHAEDLPASATHLAVLRDGRLAYSGPITPAALRKAFPASPPAVSVNSLAPVGRQAPRRRAPRELVSMRRASVYVDGIRILQGIGFSVREGECWVVHGGNGAGKSTLLKTLYGDHPVASGGSIQRHGVEPGVPLQDFRAWVGYIAPQLQTDHPQYLQVLDTVGSGLHSSIGLNQSLTASERRRARAALEGFGLTDFETRTLRAISYGQLRRVLFARAWVRDPRLLLLDEPYAGIDTPTRAALIARLDTRIAAGGTVVIATHHRAEWPAATTHELELSGGRVVYCGPIRP
jgi:molybdate transport system ATP-binding protein